MHHVQPPRGCNRIGKLASHLRDLRHRQKGRDRDQHQQRQQCRLDPTVQHQWRANRGNRQAAKPGRNLQAGGLSRQVLQQRQPHRLVASHIGHELVAPPRRRFERHQFRQALDRLRRVRPKFTQRAPRRGRHPVDALPPNTGEPAA